MPHACFGVKNITTRPGVIVHIYAYFIFAIMFGSKLSTKKPSKNISIRGAIVGIHHYRFWEKIRNILNKNQHFFYIYKTKTLTCSINTRKSIYMYVRVCMLYVVPGSTIFL